MKIGQRVKILNDPLDRTCEIVRIENGLYFIRNINSSVEIPSEFQANRLIPEISLYRDNNGKIEPFKFKLNDAVQSKITGKKGMIQATYGEHDRFMMYTGEGYEYLKESEMFIVSKDELPFRWDLHKIDETTEANM